MTAKCARCTKTVYPTEELKCLDKSWHKSCFKCDECGMALNMKTYKGYNKIPYCSVHCPSLKPTTVAETPESRRLAENTRLQSQVKYHEDFEKAKGKLTQVADDPETVRIRNTHKIISNAAYHGDLEKKQEMEKKRTLVHDDSVTPSPDSHNNYSQVTQQLQEGHQQQQKHQNQTSHTNGISSGGMKQAIRYQSESNTRPVTQQQQHPVLPSTTSCAKDVERNPAIITTINSSSRGGQHVTPAGLHYQQQQMQYHQQQMQQRQGSNMAATANRSQVTVNGSRSSDLNENTSHLQQQQPVRGSPGQMKQQNMPMQSNPSSMYNSSPSKINPNIIAVPIAAENHVMQGNYQTNPVKSSHSQPSQQTIQHPNHPSAIIYTSDHGPVHEMQPSRKIGSIVDYDPLNDNYGSIAAGYRAVQPANYTTSYYGPPGSQQQHLIQQQQQQQLQMHHQKQMMKQQMLQQSPHNVPVMGLQQQQHHQQQMKMMQQQQQDLTNRMLQMQIQQQHQMQQQQLQHQLMAQQKHQLVHQQQPQQQQQQQQQSRPVMLSQYGSTFRAIYDYAAQDTDEVSFLDGDVLINCVSIDEGWMTGTVQRTGQKGMLPANYVEPIHK